MITDYDFIDDIHDIEFNGDICSKCIHEPHCTTLKMIQTGALTVNNPEPIVYCAFYQGRTPANILGFLKEIFRRSA